MAFASRANPKTDVIHSPRSFEDSRRLTGPNRHFAECGAVLETLMDAPLSAAVLERWRQEVVRACSVLSWQPARFDARPMPRGASLAISAPLDQLFTATEINEWAWQRAAGCDDGFHAPGHAALSDLDSGLQTLRLHAHGECNPALVELLAAADSRGLSLYADEYQLSLGEGVGSRVFDVAVLPSPVAVPWSDLRDIPKVLVTGSNGKTTSVRLLAAMARAHGWCTGHTCTDGMFVNGQVVEAGDFSGPSGARSILRRPEVEAAVLEAARGGLLRRGLAVRRADVALVTNVSVEHFGEYGIHDLAALADVKLSLARAIDARGTLVLNADDVLLLAKSSKFDCALAWFALDDQHPVLLAHRARSGPTCAMRDGRLLLSSSGEVFDLGSVDAMPLTLGGVARYNIANLAGAALSAHALGLAPALIANVLAQFGSRRNDNPGRLQIWNLGGVRVLLDYAHNPDGLQGFLGIARAGQGDGRFGLLLGQAGNRDDGDVRALADVAASFQPDHVVLKDIDGYMRGRQSGEVAGVLRIQLLRAGMLETQIETLLDEAQAALRLLDWARQGDVIALPVHGTRARKIVSGWLDALEADHWQPGDAMPASVRGLPSAAPLAT